jgi:hypothetical protein
MSLFIAGQPFLAESDFATEKIAVFAASIYPRSNEPLRQYARA